MKTIDIQPHKSSLGMDANIAVLVIYAAMIIIKWFPIPFIGYLAWGVPLVFFILEKESKFVKSLAIQALVLGIVMAIVEIVFDIIYWIITPKTVVGAFAFLGGGFILTGIVAFINFIIGVALSLILIYIVFKAYKYKQVELPVLSPIANSAEIKVENMVKNMNQNKTSGGQNNSGSGKDDDSNNN